ncbi:hypothetical protein [Coraliomargarita sinensis]|nr:hypothetical protein [Coraliomargarita sinensis]
MEHAAGNLLNAWQNGVPTGEALFRNLSNALHGYRLEKDAKEACS